MLGTQARAVWSVANELRVCRLRCLSLPKRALACSGGVIGGISCVARGSYVTMIRKDTVQPDKPALKQADSLAATAAPWRVRLDSLDQVDLQHTLTRCTVSLIFGPSELIPLIERFMIHDSAHRAVTRTKLGGYLDLCIFCMPPKIRQILEWLASKHAVVSTASSSGVVRLCIIFFESASCKFY